MVFCKKVYWQFAQIDKPCFVQIVQGCIFIHGLHKYSLLRHIGGVLYGIKVLTL